MCRIESVNMSDKSAPIACEWYEPVIGPASRCARPVDMMVTDCQGVVTYVCRWHAVSFGRERGYKPDSTRARREEVAAEMTRQAGQLPVWVRWLSILAARILYALGF